MFPPLSTTTPWARSSSGVPNWRGQTMLTGIAAGAGARVGAGAGVGVGVGAKVGVGVADTGRVGVRAAQATTKRSNVNINTDRNNTMRISSSFFTRARPGALISLD